jgi:hypothetical protein
VIDADATTQPRSAPLRGAVGRLRDDPATGRSARSRRTAYPRLHGSATMTDVSRLEASLRTLRDEIATLAPGDDDARRRLASLVGELESAVADPARSDERRTLGEQLKSSILRIEAAHPRLAGIVNEIVESLGNMGI